MTKPKTSRKKGSPLVPASSTAPAYLGDLHPEVRAQFEGAVDLPTFLASAGKLSLEDRKLIVEQALVLMVQNYAHLPLKKAMHAVDPVQRLRLLQQQLQQNPPNNQPPETEFHRELTEIFTSVRDLHTNYILPEPFNGMVAFLPFMVEDYKSAGERRYLVSRVAQGFSHPTFVEGVEIKYWNGMHIEKAVWNQAWRYAGSNREARHARAVQTLTTRTLMITLPPDEDWVVVHYQSLDDEMKELRFDWQLKPPLLPPETAEARMGVEQAAAMGIDLEQERIQETRKVIFAPQIIARENAVAAKILEGNALGDLESAFPAIFEARSVHTAHGTFGYLRIRTFNKWPPDVFVQEFIRLISGLPQTGLIIDVRGNGGGVIMNGELILQLLTARRIEPEPVQFINTPLNLAICKNNGPTSGIDLSPWVESMEQSLQTGAVYSSGFPITSHQESNVIGQKYFGPVVLIMDALCYSTTDIFCAGFQDHNIGPVLGTDGATGAGGANVWEHTLLQQFSPRDESPYKSLPKGANMRVAIRRSLRVGERTGTPVEDLGVMPDKIHDLTREDLLNGNKDLIESASALLVEMPARIFNVSWEITEDGNALLSVRSKNIDRLDVYVRTRPYQSLDIKDIGAAETVTELKVPTGQLELQGFQLHELVSRFRQSL
jgi:hypothetical protein